MFLGVEREGQLPLLGLNVRKLRQLELLQPLGALPESNRNLRSLVLGKILVLTCYEALYFVDLLVPGLGDFFDSLWISSQNVANAITFNLTKLFSELLDLEDVLLQERRDLGLRDGGNIVEVLGFQVLNLGTLNHPAVPDKGHFCDPKSPGNFLNLTQYRFGVIRIALENLSRNRHAGLIGE